MKKWICVDTGCYWMNVVEIVADNGKDFDIEPLLEEIAPALIKSGLGQFIEEGDVAPDLFNDWGEIEGYTYLDLSPAGMGNYYMRIENLRVMDEIPETYNIDLTIDLREAK